jgi:hypothetical protein
MNKHKKRIRFLLLAVIAALGALLGACGTDSPTGKTVQTQASAPTGTATVGLKKCTTCHTVQTADWMLTKHANVEPIGNLYSQGNPTIGQIYTNGVITNPVTSPVTCRNCHDPLGDSGQLVANYTGNVARPVIGCESCHGGGGGPDGHVAKGGAGPIGFAAYTAGVVSGTTSSVQVSAQFATCTSCHELLDMNDPVNTAATPSHLSALTPTGSAYTIIDTHFATSGNWSGPGGASVKAITGYSMNFASEKVCVDCHNPHKAPTQNREWAQSAHGDKNPFNLNSTQTGYFSGAWAHYNWSLTQWKACQRCHTTTGFTAYADALRTGDRTRAALINAGTVSPSLLDSNAAFKPEMLKCNGCHTDNKGTLRNPGAITADYGYVSSGKTYAISSHTYPDLAGSNVCMTCHVGRETGDTVKGLNDPALLSSGSISAFNFTNFSFINSHYLTAGGQVFTVTGYKFDGRPYNNIPEYLHDKIGTPATKQLAPYVDTGSNGPCIGCHMSRPNKNGNHLFLPVSRGTGTASYGVITGIASEVCMRCHGPSPTLILDLVREQKLQFTGAMEALKEQMTLKLQMYFLPYSPYWFRTAAYTDPKVACTENVPVKNWQTGGSGELTSSNLATMPSCTQIAGTNSGTPGTGQNNMGAAFNFNLLEHDPGAYVHNRMYVKRLIYDSIDWVDDGVMNYSVGATLNALNPGTDPYKAEAMTYLLPNGVLSIEAERP